MGLPPSEEGVIQLTTLQDRGSGAPRADTPVGGAGTVAAGGLGIGVGEGTVGGATGVVVAGGGGAVAHSTTHRCSSPGAAEAAASDSARSEQAAEALRNRDVHCSKELCGHGNARL